MIGAGWHYLADDDGGAPLPVATFLEAAEWDRPEARATRGELVGTRSGAWLVRLWARGPADQLGRARAWRGRGAARIQPHNEPNLLTEWRGATPRGVAAWFRELVDRLGAGHALYYPGFSPTSGDRAAHNLPDLPWTAWIDDADQVVGAALRAAAGLVGHAYGRTLELLQAAARPLLELGRRLGKPVWFGEVNWGDGETVDVGAWARGPFRAFLDWLAAEWADVAEAVCFFAHRWPTPDGARRGTPLDGTGTAVEEVLRAWRPPAAVESPAAHPGGAGAPGGSPDEAPRDPANRAPELILPHPEEPSPMPDTVHPESYYRELARGGYRAHDLDPLIGERQAFEECGYSEAVIYGWGGRQSTAGAKGMWQIVPAYHPGVNVFDPVESTAYATNWMAAMVRQHGGDYRKALAFYNGGVEALADLEAGRPLNAETARYLRDILGPRNDDDTTVKQFGPDLPAAGFAADWIGSACGPIGVAGLCRSLLLEVRAKDVLARAPEVGWTPAAGVGAATRELARRKLVDLAALFGVALVAIARGEVDEHLRRGRFVLAATGHHVYLAQRRSRTDAELYVGNTGEARLGGRRWMSLDAIDQLDADLGGINGLWVGYRAADAAAAAVDPVTDALNGLWQQSIDIDRAGDHDGAVAMQRRLVVVKGALPPAA